MCFGMHGCAMVCIQVHADTHGYALCMGMHGCVWDEFSEYLLETRVLTSADFTSYP